MALALGGASSLSVNVRDGLLLFLQGAIVLPLALALITLGSQYILPAEVSLYMLIEVPVGSLWVYIAGYEAPPRYTIYGGAILLTTLAINGFLDVQDSRHVMNAGGATEIVVSTKIQNGTIEIETTTSPMALECKI